MLITFCSGQTSAFLTNGTQLSRSTNANAKKHEPKWPQNDSINYVTLEPQFQTAVFRLGSCRLSGSDSHQIWFQNARTEPKKRLERDFGSYGSVLAISTVESWWPRMSNRDFYTNSQYIYMRCYMQRNLAIQELFRKASCNFCRISFRHSWETGKTQVMHQPAGDQIRQLQMSELTGYFLLAA